MPDPQDLAEDARASSAPSAPAPLKETRGPATRWLAYIGVFLIGFMGYWLSDLMFDAYIGHTASWLIVAAMSAIALWTWIRDERALSREHPEDE